MLWRYCGVNKPCGLIAAQAQVIGIPFNIEKGKIHVVRSRFTNKLKYKLKKKTKPVFLK